MAAEKSDILNVTPLPPVSDDVAAMGWMNCFKQLEARVRAQEEEGRRMKEEIGGLRDRLEEEVWQRQRLEKKMEEIMQGREAEERQERAGEEWKKEIKEAEERIMEKMEEEKKKKKKRCLVLTDSNGRNGTTASSIRYHMPEEDKDAYDVNIAIAYRIAEATDMVKQGDLAIDGAVVLIDCHNNDARQTKRYPKLPPNRYIQELDKLRKELWDKGAADVIVCSLKPTQRADVSEYVDLVHRYLVSMEGKDGGHGCHTQVRTASIFSRVFTMSCNKRTHSH